MIFCMQIIVKVISITLGVHSQAFPKYPKQQVYNIFAISQEKCEGWSKFFVCKYMSKVSSNWCYHFRCLWPGMPRLFKINLLFICNILRKKCGEVGFCMQISIKVCCKLILWFWWGWSSIPKVSKIASWQCLYNISKKNLEMKLIFCMEINIKVSISWHYPFWWTQNRNSVIFLKYSKKKEWQILLCSIVKQNI